MRTAVDMVLQKTGITPDNGNMEYISLLKEKTAGYGMAQLNSLAEATAGLEKGMRKESDTYAMYAGIISIVRKLHKDSPCMDAEKARTVIQPVKSAETAQKEAPVRAVQDTIPMPEPESDSIVFQQAENNPDSPVAENGIDRNIYVLPDLEQALMDFLPDLKHEPQGRFDSGSTGIMFLQETAAYLMIRTAWRPMTYCLMNPYSMRITDNRSLKAALCPLASQKTPEFLT